MFGFAMDCFGGGIGLTILTYGLAFAYRVGKEKEMINFLDLGCLFLFMGLSILLLSNFLVSFGIVWNTWE